MSSAYKEDERILSNIIKNNIRPRNESDKIHLSIYYKSLKTKDLLLKNNNSTQPSGVASTCVVYKFICPYGDCTPQDCYVGLTRTTLSRRLTCHLSNGGPKSHLQEKHGTEITRKILEENTEILERQQERVRLTFLEALHIKDIQPTMNRQMDMPIILPSMRPFRRTRNLEQNNTDVRNNTDNENHRLRPHALQEPEGAVPYNLRPRVPRIQQ